MVLRAQNSPGTLGPLQRCASGQAACVTDPNQDSSRFNQSNTVSFALPACPNGIDSILIEGGSVAVVQCAAPAQSGVSSTTTDPNSSAVPSTSTVTNP